MLCKRWSAAMEALDVVQQMVTAKVLDTTQSLNTNA
jgi:hypothetical protein